MKLLARGSQSEYRLNRLLNLKPKLSSSNIKYALKLHLVSGFEEIEAAEIAGIPRQNLFRALRSLEEVAKEVEAIKEYDLFRIES